ncbi:hypothetical protein [Arthrobacter sp. StoSoilB20]|uniref:hypothetical protein n=1 Tax=Arthrobacter sp. StoSoilB20 TaxID=2830995 RepID=UPI001CC374CE|nr:hypothetical protein [Arthrobacter sp. StoSoilB20]
MSPRKTLAVYLRGERIGERRGSGLTGFPSSCAGKYPAVRRFSTALLESAAGNADAGPSKRSSVSPMRPS